MTVGDRPFSERYATRAVMKNTLLSVVLLSLSCARPAPVVAVDEPVVEEAVAAVEAAIEAVAEPSALLLSVTHTDRPADDVARDGHRSPEAVMAFADVGPGDTVLDLMGGKGYFTELFSRAVGSDGTVYVQNNAHVIERYAQGPLTERLARPGLENITRLDVELHEIEVEAGSVDIAFMGLFYHDTYWLEVDRAAMNARIFAALKPGGFYVISDHYAAEGAGVDHVKTLHRIERHIVLEDVLAAGFVLDEESELLRHPDDARTANVFDEGMRGMTDRFLLRFVKPTDIATP